MKKSSGRKAVGGMRLGIILAFSFCFMTEAQAELRTIYYLPYASYNINYSGNPYEAIQVIFLGTVRSAICEKSQSESFQGQIQLQFIQYIESQYRSRLGLRYQWTERLGYWRWDSGEELIGMHGRIANHYPRVEHIDTFYYNCGGVLQQILNSGRFKSEVGDSVRIKDLGGGRYHFEAWAGSGDTPATNLWYNIGVGIMGSDGLIHCIHDSAVGYANPHIITESYWKIIDPLTIKQIKYRFYTQATKPASQDSGWREGPAWRFVE